MTVGLEIAFTSSKDSCNVFKHHAIELDTTVFQWHCNQVKFHGSSLQRAMSGILFKL